MRVTSEELRQAIHNCKAELLKAQSENMEGTKGGLRKAEQHVLEAYKILRNVILRR